MSQRGQSKPRQGIRARPYQPTSPASAPPVRPPPPQTRPVPRAPKAYYVFSGIIGSICLYGITAYSYSYFSAPKQCSSDHGLPAQDTDVSPIYDETANAFDSCVGLSEFLGGINRQRKKLARQAKGHVLEVSVGTGRNFKYYNLDYTSKDYFANTRYAELLRRHNEQEARRKEAAAADPQAIPDIATDVPALSPWTEARSKTLPTRASLKKKATQVSTLTFLDLSAPMIDVARRKFEQRYPGYAPVQFLTQSALFPLPPSPITDTVRAQGGYDTILQTMGLCSTPDPVQLLRHLGELAHPERGRILLLEHGRGNWGWMNGYLDRTAARHAKRHGCWYNRDIGAIVEESGLVVEKVRRKHFGTLWVVEARVRREGEEVGMRKGLAGLEKQTVVEVLEVNGGGDKQSKEQMAAREGLTSRAWGCVKSLTGMNQMKEEDPGFDEDASKKEGS